MSNEWCKMCFKYTNWLNRSNVAKNSKKKNKIKNDFNLKCKRHEIEQRKQHIFSVVYVQTTVGYKRLALDRRYWDRESFVTTHKYFFTSVFLK